MVVSGKATNSTKQKVPVIGTKLKDALKWAPTQIKIELQEAIFHI